MEVAHVGSAGTDPRQPQFADHDQATLLGQSPWRLAWRRLRRNRVALAAVTLFALLVIACALAPVYAKYVAKTGPHTNHLTETVIVDGQERSVVSAGGVYTDQATGQLRIKPIEILGPTWWHAGGRFVLGADTNGRDVAVRLLYGGLNSLAIGIGSALICTALAIMLALVAGYRGGIGDFFVSRLFDLIWAFPVILLGIALGTALAVGGFHHWFIDIEAGSLWIPTLVISIVLIPYVGRPLRGEVLSLRQKEFVDAAISEGAGSIRIMLVEILPNIASTALVLFALIIANNILVEAALSFLGAGVQPPTPSWGTLIAEGQNRIVSAPWLTLAPGLALILTVVSLNVFGDGLRDALDPHAKVKLPH
jgi:peptide/nickel transport system permease protein